MTVSAQTLLELLKRQRVPVSARDIAAFMRHETGRDVRKRDVNPLLYARADLFGHDSGSPPKWSLRASDSTGSISPVRPTPDRVQTSPPPSRLTPTFPTVRPPASASPPNLPEDSSPRRPAPAHQPTGSGSTQQHDRPRSAGTGSGFEAWPFSSLAPYAWQLDALRWWQVGSFRGCLEAVTGTGKTLVGLACIALAHKAGHRTLVLVPTVVLQDQWIQRVRAQMPRLRIARLGGSDRSTAGSSTEHDVLIAVINSASTASGSLQGQYGCLVADECHRYGAGQYRRALIDAPWRLGLTGTLERLDGGIESVIKPYFGRIYTYSYDKATADGVLASFVIAMVGMRLSAEEQDAYRAADDAFKKAYGTLVNQYGYPGSDFGELLRRAAGASGGIMSRFTSEGRAARTLTASFAERRRILAESPERLTTLRKLAPSVLSAGKALVFTETVEAANAACRALREMAVEAAPYHSDIGTAERVSILQRFKEGRIRALVAVKALDEGVDVPDVDLGIVLTASQQRRQMVQRLGRVIRKKPDGRYACFVHVFAEGTGEDPDQGAQEAFVDQIAASADEFERFSAGHIEAALQFISDFAGKRANETESPKPDDGAARSASSASAEPASAIEVVNVARSAIVRHAREPASQGPAAGLAVQIGPRVFDVDADIERREFGVETELSYRGQRIGKIGRTTTGLVELEILVAAHQSIRLVDPTVEMKRAAMVLGILAAERRASSDSPPRTNTPPAQS